MPTQNPNEFSREQLSVIINFLNTGKINKALDAINVLISEFPDHALLYNLQGVCFETNNQLKPSIKSFKKAISIFPKYTEALYNLGVVQNKSGKKIDSIKSYQKAISIKPDHFDAHNNLGLALSQTKKFEEAIIHLNHAVNIKPNFAEAFNNMGLTYIELNENNKAINSFKKAISLDQYFQRARINLGHIYHQVGKLNLAMQNYRRLLEVNPKFAEAYVFIGILYKHKGLPIKAIENFEKALNINPNLLSALYELSNDSQYVLNTGMFDKLESLLRSDSLSQNDQIILYYTLANVYEKNQMHKKFFEFLDKANKLRKNLIGYSFENDKKKFNSIKRFFNSSSSQLPKSIKKLSIKKSPIFIVGMPRSGSTLVEQILTSHKEVYGSGELDLLRKILNPFIVSKEEENFKAIRQQYIDSIYQLDFSESIFTDKSLLNFQYIGYILDAFPEAKIIHIKRDPMAICWSNYKTNFSQSGLGFTNNLIDLVNYYNHYEEIMIFWHKKFPNKIYDLQYENLTTNQELETSKLLNYCNLNWDENCLHFYNNKRSVLTASKDQVRDKMYQGSSEAWKKYKSHLQPLIKGLESYE
jgi:tetratricopeptide (TPR) repeat protein